MGLDNKYLIKLKAWLVPDLYRGVHISVKRSKHSA